MVLAVIFNFFFLELEVADPRAAGTDPNNSALKKKFVRLAPSTPLPVFRPSLDNQRARSWSKTQKNPERKEKNKKQTGHKPRIYFLVRLAAPLPTQSLTTSMMQWLLVREEQVCELPLVWQSLASRLRKLFPPLVLNFCSLTCHSRFRAVGVFLSCSLLVLTQSQHRLPRKRAAEEQLQ